MNFVIVMYYQFPTTRNCSEYLCVYEQDSLLVNVIESDCIEIVNMHNGKERLNNFSSCLNLSHFDYPPLKAIRTNYQQLFQTQRDLYLIFSL